MAGHVGPILLLRLGSGLAETDVVECFAVELARGGCGTANLPKRAADGLAATDSDLEMVRWGLLLRCWVFGAVKQRVGGGVIPGGGGAS
jgi:hypothetical protein